MDTEKVQASTYNLSESIDWLVKHSTDAKWDCVVRAMDILTMSIMFPDAKCIDVTINIDE